MSTSTPPNDHAIKYSPQTGLSRTDRYRLAGLVGIGAMIGFGDALVLINTDSVAVYAALVVATFGFAGFLGYESARIITKAHTRRDRTT